MRNIFGLMVVGLFIVGCSGDGGGNATTPTLPSLTVGTASTTESDAGPVNVAFTVSLSAVSSTDVSVDYATTDGTAGASDYTSTSGTLTIPAGSTTGTVTVIATGDLLAEADETFSLNLSNPSNATLATTSVLGTIIDNDAPTAVSGVGLVVGSKSLNFTWTAGNKVDHYRISVNPDGGSGFTVDPYATNIVNTATNHSLNIPVHKINWLAAQYIVEACDVSEQFCVASPNQTVTLADSVAATIYVKASNTNANDVFGFSVAVSGDGYTMAVSAPSEDSAATGINGNQTSNASITSGAVYVFVKNANVWSQQAYIKASNTGVLDDFGRSVSLSDDGNTLAVGARGEGSAATGVNGNQLDNTKGLSGAVYVFTRTGVAWSQQAYVKASNTRGSDYFGSAVALSGDGNTLAVGTPWEDSNATGIGGNQLDISANKAGAVFVFTRTGAVWTQQAYVKASNTGVGDEFGTTVSLSGDGSTLAIGASREASSATGIGGNQLDDTAVGSGAAYVFTRSIVGMWSQEAYIKASNTDASDGFGIVVAISDDGNTLAVGANNEASGATGVGGNQADNTVGSAGSAYVFNRIGTVWTQQAYIKASNTNGADIFAFKLDLSGDGNTLAVGAQLEDSLATGVGGAQANTTSGAGAVYVFERTSNTWTQKTYVKASNTEANDNFGSAVALNGDGQTLAVAAKAEDSVAIGVGGSQVDNTASFSGAVYLY